MTIRNDRPGLGIGVELLAILAFALSDIAAKSLTSTMPAVEVTWFRYLFFCLIIFPYIFILPGPRSLRTDQFGYHMLRGLTLAGSSLTFIAGLTFLPVADATAINFIGPIFITAMSVLVLKETVKPWRWFAAAISFIGVMLVVRPGAASFQPAALLPMASALFWTLVIMTTRMMQHERAEVTMAWSSGIGLVVLTPFVPFVWQTPSFNTLVWIAMMGGMSMIGHFLTIIAYRAAPSSVIAPFSYFQLIFAGLLGFMFFGDLPEGTAFLGTSLIFASGIYSLLRGVLAPDRRAPSARSNPSV